MSFGKNSVWENHKAQIPKYVYANATTKTNQ